MSITEAEEKIARILQQLEKDTDCIVSGVYLHDIDVTRFGDKRKTLRRCVQIETYRLPGNDWGQE